MLVGPLERDRVGPERRDQDVEVPGRAELTGEPRELASKVVHPGPVQDRPRSPEDRAQAADRDAKLVNVLGILPEPDSRVVREDSCVLLAEERAQAIEGGRGDRQLGFLLALESPPEWTGAVRGLRARLPERLLQAGELLAVGGERLELDLAERARGPLTVEDRDPGDVDPRQRPAACLHTQIGRPRPHTSGGSEREPGRGGGDQLTQLVRRLCGTSQRLEVERRRAVARDAQPPDPLSVLQAAAQREARLFEAAPGGVVERLRVDTRREQAPVQRW